VVVSEQKKPNCQNEEVALEARQASAAHMDAFLALVAQCKWEEAAANLPDLSFMTVSHISRSLASSLSARAVTWLPEGGEEVSA
jgi:hypothetical protein